MIVNNLTNYLAYQNPLSTESLEQRHHFSQRAKNQLNQNNYIHRRLWGIHNPKQSEQQYHKQQQLG